MTWEDICLDYVREAGRAELMDLLSIHGIQESDLSDDDLVSVDRLRKIVSEVMFVDA